MNKDDNQLNSAKVTSSKDLYQSDAYGEDVEWAITRGLGEDATPIYPTETNNDEPRNVGGGGGNPEFTYQKPKFEDYEPPVSKNPIGDIASPNPETDPIPTIKVTIEEPIECYGPEKPLGPKTNPDGVEWAITSSLGEEATPIYPQENKRDNQDDPNNIASTNAIGEEGDADLPTIDLGDRFIDPIYVHPDGTISHEPPSGSDVEWAITRGLGEDATPIYPKDNNDDEPRNVGDDRIDLDVPADRLDPPKLFDQPEIACEDFPGVFVPNPETENDEPRNVGGGGGNPDLGPKLEVVECYGPEEPKIEEPPICIEEPKNDVKVLPVIECYGEPADKVVVMPAIECYESVKDWSNEIISGKDLPQNQPGYDWGSEQNDMRLLMDNVIDVEDVISWGKDSLDGLLDKTSQNTVSNQVIKDERPAEQGFSEAGENLMSMASVDLDII